MCPLFIIISLLSLFIITARDAWRVLLMLQILTIVWSSLLSSLLFYYYYHAYTTHVNPTCSIQTCRPLQCFLNYYFDRADHVNYWLNYTAPLRLWFMLPYRHSIIILSIPASGFTYLPSMLPYWHCFTNWPYWSLLPENSTFVCHIGNYPMSILYLDYHN